jgi:hypothetical protein
LQARHLLPRLFEIRIPIGGKLAHRLDLNLFGRHLGAQHGRRGDHGVGLAVQLDYAGALLGLLHLIFGVRQILARAAQLLLEKKPSSGGLAHRQGRRE